MASKAFWIASRNSRIVLAHRDSGQDLGEGVAGDVEDIGGLLHEIGGTLQGRAIDIDLVDLQSLQRVGILGIDHDIGGRLAGGGEFLVLLVDQALDGGAVLHRDLDAGEIVEAVDVLGIALMHQQGLAGIHVVDEIDDLAALRLVEELGEDGVAMLGLQRRDDAVEGRVGEFGGDAEALGDLGADIDVGADRLVVLVEIAERRAGDVGAVDDLAGAGDIGRRRHLGRLRGQRRGEAEGHQAAASPNVFLRVVIASSLEFVCCVELACRRHRILPASKPICIWFHSPVRLHRGLHAQTAIVKMTRTRMLKPIHILVSS